VIAAKECYDSILVKEIQQQNDGVHESTEVDSAMVSPIIKHLPDDNPCAADTCRKLKDTYKYTDIL
jgi:hypothetical protein